jgi:hypothetical protein
MIMHIVMEIANTKERKVAGIETEVTSHHQMTRVATKERSMVIVAYIQMLYMIGRTVMAILMETTTTLISNLDSKPQPQQWCASKKCGYKSKRLNIVRLVC